MAEGNCNMPTQPQEKRARAPSFSPNRLDTAQRDRPPHAPRWSINKLQRPRRALPARYCTSRFKSQQSDGEGCWQTITLAFLPRLPQNQVSGFGVRNQRGLAVTLPSGRGPGDTQPQWQRLGVINHGQWQSDKRCSEADWEEKLL